MGSCFGHCVSKEAHAATSAASSCLWPGNSQATDEQEAELMSNASDNNKCQRPNFIFRIIKFKSKKKRPQFIEKFWEQQDLRYSKLNNRNGTEALSDIQLQNLDVNSLLSNASFSREESVLNQHTSTGSFAQTAAAVSSRASSSLDLEWEHEYAQMLGTRQQHPPNLHHHNHHYAINGQSSNGATQALLHCRNCSNNNVNLCNSCNDTPSHHSNSMISNHNNNSLYDNQLLQVQLHDSWQYLSNDEEQQVNSASQPLSVSHAAPINGARSRERLRTTVPNSKQQLQQGASLERNNSSFTRTSSHASWSHISTPESLEWDQDEEQQRQLRVEDDSLDHETLELLHQIEQLKNRVLNETGDGLFDEDVAAGVTSSHAAMNAGRDADESMAPIDKCRVYGAADNNS